MFLTELRSGVSYQEEVTVEFDKKYDVVVAGLGTAGALAAISAAEAGARVLGIERINMCGGTGTAGGVFGYYFGLPGGKFEDIDQKAKELQDKSFIAGGCFHPDTKSIIQEQMLCEYGAEIAYDTTIVGVFQTDENVVKGVRLITPDGVKNIACHVVIDATGEGDVCAMAGADFQLGRESDSQPQPFSSIRVFVRDGRLGLANFDAGYAVPTDAADMTKGMLHANSLHEECQFPLQWITTIPGTREGRLIECDERLTFSDFMNGKKADNPVAYCYSNFDSHSQDWAFESDDAKDWMVAASLWGKNFTFPVPLETMLVKNFSNLMAVGRCFSVDHIMACALRMQRGMQKLGQAAGITAAMAAKADCELREIDKNKLVETLKKDQCLDDSNLPDCSYPTDVDELVDMLKSNKPGEAIWFMARNIRDFQAVLIKSLESSDANLAKHSALALGIANRKEALPVLYRIIEERDDFMPESSRSHNHLRIAGALHVLGKIKQKENVQVLLNFVKKNNDLNIQEMSHAVMSLLALGNSLESERVKIAEVLECIMNVDSFSSFKLLLKNSSFTGSDIFEPMANLMRLLAVKELDRWGIVNSIIDNVDKANLTWREKILVKGNV